MKELIQLKQKDLLEIRKKWYSQQEGICPILKQVVPFENTVVDHQHKLKAEPADETGKGCVRGVLFNQANALEGKISNNFKRYGLNKYIDLPSFLRNLADYLEHNHLDDDILYIHPNEAPSYPILSKNSYNKVKSLWAKDTSKKPKTFPLYSKKMTKGLMSFFKRYNIEPIFNGV